MALISMENYDFAASLGFLEAGLRTDPKSLPLLTNLAITHGGFA